MPIEHGMPSQSPPAAVPFVPASGHIVMSGTQTRFRDLIVLGVLNGLVVALSHVIFSLHALLGPLAYVFELYHQSFENIFLSCVYLLMALTAPRSGPFTLNAVVWSAMGLMSGWWPLAPVALPAGLAADMVLRRAVPRRRFGVVVLCFAFYAAMLSCATYWPYIFLKQGFMMQRLMAMDPGVALLVERFTWPVFLSQAGAAFLTGLVGGRLALKFISRHFALERMS